MALINFNAANVDPQVAFEPIPGGWYDCMIVASEQKANSAGTGSYISLTVKVLAGSHANRQVFDNLNLDHPNVVTKEIAEKRLSAYCHATGVIQLQDTQQLHGIPISVKIGIKIDKTGQYEPQNDIRAVRALGQGVPAGATGVAPAGSIPPAGFQPQAASYRPATPPGVAPPPAYQTTQPTYPAAPATYQAPPLPQATAPMAPPTQPKAATPAGGPPPWAKRK